MTNLVTQLTGKTVSVSVTFTFNTSDYPTRTFLPVPIDTPYSTWTDNEKDLLSSWACGLTEEFLHAREDLPDDHLIDHVEVSD